MLEQFEEYQIDVPNKEFKYYLGAEVIGRLGYKNITQTIRTHCQHAISHSIKKINIKGEIITKIVKLISEEDVYNLIRFQEKLRQTPYRQVSLRGLDAAIEEINLKIGVLRKELDHVNEDKIEELHANQYLEIEDLILEEGQAKVELEEEIKEEIDAKIAAIISSPGYDRKRTFLINKYASKKETLKNRHLKELEKLLDRGDLLNKIEKLEQKKKRILKTHGYK